MDSENEVRAAVVKLIAPLDLAGLKRVRRLIEKRSTTFARSNACKPRDAPIPNWVPKHPEIAKTALRLMAGGVGVRGAPPGSEASEWSHKLMISDLAVHVVGSMESKASVPISTIAVAQVCARVVEHANALKSEDRFADSCVAMQGCKEFPGWLKSTTRGSGIVYGGSAGKALFEEALALVVVP